MLNKILINYNYYKLEKYQLNKIINHNYKNKNRIISLKAKLEIKFFIYIK